MRALLSGLLLAVLASDASALTHANQRTDGGVTLRANVSTGVVVDPGDAVSFQYQSARDGAVLVFDIDTRGNVSLLTDEPVTLRAHDSHNLPDDGSELFAEGQPGVEFVFALAVDDPSALDADAIASLRDGSRQITGDPFIAANMIAGEVVRNVALETVFMGYTYFYVSDRVDYPCYLCGTCDGTGKNECEGFHIAQNFDRNVSLAYPLARGYDMVDTAANSTLEDTSGDTVAMPNQDDAVNFYPYGTDIHYADPVAMNSWYNWGYYDPYYYYYPYSYPYCGYPYGFSVSIGWGWGWGWGGYYAGGCYNPYWGCGGYYNGCGYYPGYGNGYGSGNVVKYKSQYKGNNVAANTLTGNRTYAMKRDSNLQVASRGTKSWSAPTSYRSKTMASNYPTTGSRHVKTSVSGSRSVAGQAWASGRSKSYGGKYNGATVYRSRPSSGMYKNNNNAGRTVMDRSGNTRSKSGATYGNGSTRMKSGNSSYRSNHTWTPSNSGRSSGSTMRGNSGSYKSAPAYRGGSGSSWGGSRSGFSGGGRSGGYSGGHSGGGAMRGGYSGGGHGGGKGR